MLRFQWAPSPSGEGGACEMKKMSEEASRIAWHHSSWKRSALGHSWRLE